VAAGKDCGTAAAKNEYESTYQFSCISFHTPSGDFSPIAIRESIGV
jgi:hypothetical protein